MNVRSGAEMVAGMEGWCTPHKAETLYRLASLPSTKLAAEVGIFAGKSIVPVGLAFKDKGEGFVYGVEPWENAVAVESKTNEGNDDWWSKVDLITIKKLFLERLISDDILSRVRIVELPSDAAISAFSSPRYYKKFDLVHIDGAHSVEESVHDCAVWCRLARPGAHIVLDDINWPSVKIAWDYMRTVSTEISVSENDENGYFAVFQLKS